MEKEWKILKNKLRGRRSLGRPMNRWQDAVEREIEQFLRMKT